MRLLVTILALAVALALPPRAPGGWGSGGCGGSFSFPSGPVGPPVMFDAPIWYPPPPGPPPAPPPQERGYFWHEIRTGEPGEWGLCHDGKQIGSYAPSTGFRSLFADGTWGPFCEPPVNYPQAVIDAKKRKLDNGVTRSPRVDDSQRAADPFTGDNKAADKGAMAKPTAAPKSPSSEGAGKTVPAGAAGSTAPGASQTPGAPPPPAEAMDGLLFGVDWRKLRADGRSEYRINGRPVTEADALGAIGGPGGTIPDDSKKLRLLVIGSEAERKPVMDAMPADMRDKYVLYSLPPDHWSLRPGFVTNGHPTIQLQEPDKDNPLRGKVLCRLSSFDGQRTFETIRKADPSYKPDSDPNGKPSGPDLDGLGVSGEGLGLLILAGALGVGFFIVKGGRS